MRITRIYVDQPLGVDEDIHLDKDAARHLVAVLRLHAGDPVALFNGRGGAYRGLIEEASTKGLRVRTTEFDSTDRESPLQSMLGIGISKGDRFDWVLQKATELGVSEISPLYTERTEVKLKGERIEKKLRHWRQVVISACEQCGRNRLPALHEPQPLQSFLTVQVPIKLLLHHRAGLALKELPQSKPDAVALLIGPEGGLSPVEIEQGIAAGFQSLTLGPRIMRTETAPLAALSLLQGLWGDF